MDLLDRPLPDFRLCDDQGREVTPATFAGHWTVLYAYPKDATPGCTREACDFRDAWPRITALGVKVYGLSRDSVRSHAAFIVRQSLPFPLICDPDAALLRPLGAFGPKVLYGRTMEGVIRSTFLVDPEGLVRHVWPKVRVAGHVAEVLTRLSDLMAGRTEAPGTRRR